MIFERYQLHRQTLCGKTLDVSYDRFTTAFEMRVDSECVYKKHLCFWPWHNNTIKVAGQTFTVKIVWFVIWQSSLQQPQHVVIKELLPKRRRRSISLVGYGIFVLLIKAMLIAFAPH
jgi:hypothetical protein